MEMGGAWGGLARRRRQHRFMNGAFCKRVPSRLIYGRRSACVYGPSKRKVVAIRGLRREGASIE